MKKNNLIKAFLCLLIVGFALISCGHNIDVGSEEKVEPDVSAQVSNGIVTIVKNNSSLSDSSIMLELKELTKKSNIQNGFINLKFENDANNKTRKAVNPFEDPDVHHHYFESVYIRQWDHMHKADGQSIKCHVSRFKDRCISCGKLRYLEIHTY